MDNYISISMLNDFIFCPYSIYVHSLFIESDKDIYEAKPQILGKNAHRTIDEKMYTSKDIITSLPIISDNYGLLGKIDLYNIKTKTLIERKYKIKTIYKGQILQLWAQYFCMLEMGYSVKNIQFYEISTNKNIKLNIPNETDRLEFTSFINEFRQYTPNSYLNINPNKCLHCIYSSLCDKTAHDNVFQ